MLRDGEKDLKQLEKSVHNEGVEKGDDLWKKCGKGQIPQNFHTVPTWIFYRNVESAVYSNLPLMELFRSRMISPRSGSDLSRDSTRLMEEMTVE